MDFQVPEDFKSPEEKEKRNFKIKKIWLLNAIFVTFPIPVLTIIYILSCWNQEGIKELKEVNSSGYYTYRNIYVPFTLTLSEHYGLVLGLSAFYLAYLMFVAYLNLIEIDDKGNIR